MAAPATVVVVARERLAAVDRVTWAVAAIALVALAMRLVGLGDRALHHDESLHAMHAWYFAQGEGYQHNPLMHGPLQFHVIAALFVLLGDSDATVRLFSALTGAGLVVAPLLLRRQLGPTGVVLAAIFLAISPALLYFSRFARNDVPVALFTLLMFIAVWRYREDGRTRWLVLLAAGLGLSFAAKETAYLNVAVLLLYLNAVTAHVLFWQDREGEAVSRRAQVLHALWLVPVAWIIAALWGPLERWRERRGFFDRPREADLLVVTGTLVLPLLAAAVLIPVERWYGELAEGTERSLGVVTVLALIGGSVAVGIGWSACRWLLAAAVAYAIMVPLYASMGTNVEGVAGAFWTSLAYWIEQHDVQRGNQPAYYYAMLVPFYEALTLVPALIGGLWLVLWRRDGFAAMLLFWAAGTFVALSMAGEKMPWLTVPIALPLAILAAYALGRALPAAWRAVREGRGSTWQWAGGGVAVALGAVLLVHTLWTDLALNARHPDTPVEPLIYVQTTPEVPQLAREVHARLADGRAEAVLVDQTQSLSWPWAWYLRDVPAQYGSAEVIREGWAPGTIVIAAAGTLTAFDERREGFSEVVPYRHRWWFPEDRYREMTWGSFARGVVDGSLPGAWLRFALERTDEGEIGALHGEVLFP